MRNIYSSSCGTAIAVWTHGPIPGTERRGEEAAAQGRRILMDATGATDITDAVAVALGRPRTDAVRTTTVKAVMPEPLAERVHRLARREHVSAAQVLRTATAEYLERMAA